MDEMLDPPYSVNPTAEEAYDLALGYIECRGRASKEAVMTLLAAQWPDADPGVLKRHWESLAESRIVQVDTAGAKDAEGIELLWRREGGCWIVRGD